MKVVGKVVEYRRPYCADMTKSEVVSLRKLVNLAGEEVSWLKMANGDEVAGSACYFDFSTASASD